MAYTDDGNQIHSAEASFAVGCDGANSCVRESMGVTSHDLGFFFDWLIVDTMPLDERAWSPQNWQLCDPARPTTIVSGGPGRRRWEFMRLPGEDREDLDTPDAAWKLLEPWGRTPQNTRIERHAVYSFAARWADRWNTGRLAIAGDAAHLMPPFAGQGMCSGIRDAANLSWKLDRVLRGQSDIALLDSYTSERSVHLQHAITMSVELGRVICVLDPREAAERDRRMIGGGADPERVLPVTALPVLGNGVTATTDSVPALRGTLLPQFPVIHCGRTKLLDEATGHGALILVYGTQRAVSEEVRPLLSQADVRVVTIDVEGDPDLVDGDGCWKEWFAINGVECVLVRPDHYVFGALDSCADIAGLASQYLVKIHGSKSIESTASQPYSRASK